MTILGTGVAHSAPIVVTYEAAPIGPALTDFGSVGSPIAWDFQRFNPALGDLLSMTLEFEADLMTVLQVTNNGVSPSNGDAFARFRLFVQDDLLSFSTPQINELWGDFSYTLATSASTTSGVLESFADYSQLFTNPTVLGNFTGSGFETLDFYTITSTFLGNSGGNTSATQTTTAGLTGRVIYEYEEFEEGPPPQVPEPSSMFLLGSGILALGYSIKRRKKS